MSTPPRPKPRATVAGQPAADRLMGALDYRLSPGIGPLTRAHVAVVLHALADHTAIEVALRHEHDPSGYAPHATSVGRWLHAVADDLEDFPT